MNNRNQFSFFKTLFTMIILLILFLGYAIYYNVKEKLNSEIRKEFPLQPQTAENNNIPSSKNLSETPQTGPEKKNEEKKEDIEAQKRIEMWIEIKKKKEMEKQERIKLWQEKKKNSAEVSV